MNFGLIVIGDEILSGKRVDKHVPAVIEMLRGRGLGLAWARYVGDDPARITSLLREVFDGNDIVFCCGGIGATPDDHTRQCAAAALQRPLELHPLAHELILERMRDVAAEQAQAFEPQRSDNVHRLQMGMFPQGAQIIRNPYNKIPGFSVGHVHFVPGFPVMAHPMIAALLDEHYAALHGTLAHTELSVIVLGTMESALTPLMEGIEAAHGQVKVFSLPSVDHPQYGRHIELGVKGPAAAVRPAFVALRNGLQALGAQLGPELVRDAPG